MNSRAIVAVVALLALASGIFASQATNTQTATQGLKALKDGNARYVEGNLTYPHQDAERLAATAKGQHPLATVISCSDSRVPVEQVFDMGVGDVFSVRVAGNVAGPNEIATVEYGVDHLGTPVLVVLGHTQCGAVTAAVTSAEAEGSIAPLLAKIALAVERAHAAQPSKSGKELIPAATTENIWQTIEDLFANSLIIRQRVVEGKLKVIGGVYHLDDGRIEWLGSHPKQSTLLVSVSGSQSEPDEEYYAAQHPHMPNVAKVKHADGTDAAQALGLLQDGNTRFVDNQRIFPNQDLQRMQDVVSNGQHPYATILTCSDSRIPVEDIFDAGLGDIFVVRIAGNVAGVLQTGSIEYGVGHVGTPLLVVLGHSSCGAVNAVASKAELNGWIPELVDRIQPAVATAAEANPTLTGAALAEKAAVVNVWQSIQDLYAQSPEICALVKAGKLQVVGAEYQLDNGTVDWLGEHPKQAELVSATLVRCESGHELEHADASADESDNLPAVEAAPVVEAAPSVAVNKVEEQTAPQPSEPEAQKSTIGTALDKLQKNLNSLKQAQTTEPAAAPAPKPAAIAPVQTAPAQTVNETADLRQQLARLEAQVQQLAVQLKSSQANEAALTAIVSDIEYLKAENASLKGAAEQTNQKLASLDDDVITPTASEQAELAQLASLVDELTVAVEKAKSSQKPAINSPEIKKGSITMFGLVHQQYYERSGDAKQSTFDNKRARLGFQGTINNYAKVGIQGDFAKAPKLLDGFLTITPNKAWTFKAGQFQPAFGQNFLRSPAAYAVITPSLIMGLGTDRDQGLQASWEKAFSKKFSVSLTAGLFNGSGLNASDSNSTKNSVFRAQAKVADQLTLGANVYAGKTNASSKPKNLDTYGAFANWTWKSEEAEFEFIHTKVAGKDKSGWYVWAGHMFKTSLKFVPELQVVTRYEQYDADLNLDKNRTDRLTVGTNLYIDKKYTLIQLNYQFNSEEGARVRNNEFLVNFQVGF